MPFVADISRSDLLLYARCSETEAVLAAQARPRSIVPVHARDMVGHRIGPQEEATIFRAFRWRRRVAGSRRLIDGGAPVVQKVWPVRGGGGKVIAALNIEANLIADVRQRSRSKVFQGAVYVLQKMLLLGELADAGALSPFQEHDGILVVDGRRVIRYASGIATEHYRKLGYMDSLVGRQLSSLNTGDQEMFSKVFGGTACYEREWAEHPYLSDGHPRILVRKAAPLVSYRWGKAWWRPWEWIRRQPVGVLLTLHDATEERRKERELKVRLAMIREVHHRVKNNLQTVAALLRMQMRRTSSEEAKRILSDSVTRIFSMAVVHEFLSREEGQAINIREVAQRIIQETKQGVVSPEKRIRIVLDSENSLYLPARQATACALVINELLQNAVEHGYEQRTAGSVSVQLRDEGDGVCICVADDGAGLPPGFEMGQSASLGLQIVQTLVQDDLRGSFDMESVGGVRATVRFSKQVLEGEEHWNEQG
jgi:two-component sensor histidine kinase